MALTDRFIINLKATGKAHKHFDGGGLHIQSVRDQDTHPYERRSFPARVA